MTRSVPASLARIVFVLLATIGTLSHAAVPLSRGQATSIEIRAASFAAFPIKLCHAAGDDGNTPDHPAHACDDCPLCLAALGPLFAAPADGVVLPPVSLHALPRPLGFAAIPHATGGVQRPRARAPPIPA